MWEENEYALEEACQEIQENELIAYQKEISEGIEDWRIAMPFQIQSEMINVKPTTVVNLQAYLIKMERKYMKAIL